MLIPKMNSIYITFLNFTEFISLCMANFMGFLSLKKVPTYKKIHLRDLFCLFQCAESHLFYVNLVLGHPLYFSMMLYKFLWCHKKSFGEMGYEFQPWPKFWHFFAKSAFLPLVINSTNHHIRPVKGSI